MSVDMYASFGQFQLDPFIVFLSDLSDDITKDLFARLVKLTDGIINAREREELLQGNNAYDLFKTLEQQGHLSKRKSDVLEQLLSSAKQRELALIVKVRYEMGFDYEFPYNDVKEEAKQRIRNRGTTPSVETQNLMPMENIPQREFNKPQQELSSNPSIPNEQPVLQHKAQAMAVSQEEHENQHLLQPTQNQTHSAQVPQHGFIQDEKQQLDVTPLGSTAQHTQVQEPLGEAITDIERKHDHVHQPISSPTLHPTPPLHQQGQEQQSTDISYQRFVQPAASSVTSTPHPPPLTQPMNTGQGQQFKSIGREPPEDNGHNVDDVTLHATSLPHTDGSSTQVDSKQSLAKPVQSTRTHSQSPNANVGQYVASHVHEQPGISTSGDSTTAIGIPDVTPGLSNTHMSKTSSLPDDLSKMTIGGVANTPEGTIKDSKTPGWQPKSIIWRDKLAKLMRLDSAACTQVGNIKIGQDDDEYKIATGCEGTKVLLGIDISNGKEVAVKRVFKNDKTSPFINQELKIVGNTALKSDNIVKYYDMIPKGEYVYIIMELCEMTLSTYIKQIKRKKDKLSEISKQLVTDVMKGLRFLHNCQPKIIHRDLKPENILIDVNGRAKLADFGTCRHINHDQSTFLSSATGTLAWQATEVLICMYNGDGDDDDDEEEDDEDGDGGDQNDTTKQDSGLGTTADKQAKVKYSRRSDIQVAGMIIAYILSGGHHPFGKIKYPFPLSRNIESGSPQNVTKVGDAVAEHMITWMIQSEREDRPQSNQVMRHPYFWSRERRTKFLRAISAEIESTVEQNAVVQSVSESTEKIGCSDWMTRVNTDPVQLLTDYPKLLPCIYEELLQSQKTGKDNPEVNWTLRNNLQMFFTEDVV